MGFSNCGFIFSIERYTLIVNTQQIVCRSARFKSYNQKASTVSIANLSANTHCRPVTVPVELSELFSPNVQFERCDLFD